MKKNGGNGMHIENLTRQIGIIPTSILSVPHTVIGAGAIGSWTTLTLAKMGVQNISLWDFDKVSRENVSCQIFGQRHIGQFKTDALASIVEDLTGTKIQTRTMHYERGEFQGIVISAADSMLTRKRLFKNQGDTCRLFLDARMGAEEGMIFAARPYCKDYEKSLYSDEDASPLPCTARATGYTALFAASLLVATIKRYLLTQEFKKSVCFSTKAIDLM